MEVSKNSGFSPQIIHFNRVFRYKPSILRYPYFWKHPYTYRNTYTKARCISVRFHFFHHLWEGSPSPSAWRIEVCFTHIFTEMQKLRKDIIYRFFWDTENWDFPSDSHLSWDGKICCFVDWRLGPTGSIWNLPRTKEEWQRKSFSLDFILNTKKVTRSRRVESLFFQDIFWGCSTSTSCRYWEISSSFFKSWPFWFS